MEAVVHSINVNPSGGVPKHPVPLTRLTVSGVEGDRQNDLKHHGGPSRAVSLFSSELIEALQEEGHPIRPGSTGENLTLRGVMWQDMAPGVRLRIGTAHLEITAPAPPCRVIRASFKAGSFTRISERTHSGWSRWYAKVLVEGTVTQGDQVHLQPAPIEGQQGPNHP